MPDIFNIQNYNGSTNYRKNEIVFSNNLYWYSLLDGHSGNTPTVGSAAWGGNGIDPTDGQTRPEFIWSPSYGINIDLSPRIQSISFGNGYGQNIADGINNKLMNIDMQFAGRDIQETIAIIHFLNTRGGTEFFLFTPPPPVAKKKRFRCAEYPMTIDFYNNNTTSTRFIEVVA